MFQFRGSKALCVVKIPNGMVKMSFLLFYRFFFEIFVDVFVTLECIHLYISYCISLYPDGDVFSFDRERH